MMWKNTYQHDDPFTTPEPAISSRLAFKWPRAARPTRFSGLRITPIKIILFLIAVSFVVIVKNSVPSGSIIATKETAAEIYKLNLNTTLLPPIVLAPFQPPTQADPGQYRHPDIIDTFASYKFRDTCNISSLDLHTAFSPLCTDRREMLDAMSGGGRIGLDARFMTKGCDMRWYTSEEVCEILGRFDKVVLVGDSMLRHMIGSFNILMRGDLGYGAVTDWNFSMQERKDCFCNEQFDVKDCSVQGIYKTSDVLYHDPESLKCGNQVDVIMEQIVRYPIPADKLIRLNATMLGSKPSTQSASLIQSSFSKLARSSTVTKPVAVIFGHGLWSNLDVPKAMNWFDTAVNVIATALGDDSWFWTLRNT